MNWPAIKHISRNIIISLIPRNQTHEIVFRILTRVAMVTIILTSLVYVVYKEKYKENLENIQRRHKYCGDWTKFKLLRLLRWSNRQKMANIAHGGSCFLLCRELSLQKLNLAASWGEGSCVDVGQAAVHTLIKALEVQSSAFLTVLRSFF